MKNRTFFRMVGVLVLMAWSLMVWAAQPRYVFYFIGDGMGANQVMAAEVYKAALEGQHGRVPLLMSTFPVSGQLATYSQSNDITDSSAAGTALASGEKTTNGRLGMDKEGKPLKSIAEKLHNEGWLVGIMTTVAIDHATPGAFYAHVEKRDSYYEIGTQLTKSEFDFFGGAGFHRPDNKNAWKAANLYDLCEKSGYRLAHGVEEAREMWKEDRLILLQEGDGVDRTKKAESLPFAIDRKGKGLSLPEIVRTAIHSFSQKERPFFMMVEGGKIDYAGHANDGAAMVNEVLDMDAALKEAYAFYEAHPDETLIVVTADHETGGLALGNSDYTLNLSYLKYQHVSSWMLGQELRKLHQQYGKKLKWEQVKAVLEKELEFYHAVEISKEEDAALKAAYKKMLGNKPTELKTLYQDIDALTGMAVRLINKRAKLGWTTYGHSASPVPVFAIGAGAEKFTGWHDNTELPELLMKTIGR